MEQVATPILVSLATEIAKHFPELDGRAVAVADTDVTPENMPNLPICLLVLEDERRRAGSPKGHFAFSENIIVDFWFPPNRYKKEDGSETPFWSFYNYPSVRDRLLNILFDFVPPCGDKLSYDRLTIEVSQYAVFLTFRLSHDVVFMPSEVEPDGVAEVVVEICAPPSLYCPADVTQVEDEDPCP